MTDYAVAEALAEKNANLNDVRIFLDDSNTISLRSKFGLWLKQGSPKIGKPEADTNLIEVPGADFLLDLTKAVDGVVHYKKRTITMEFLCDRPRDQWHSIRDDLETLLQGQWTRFYFTRDKEVWSGQFDVTLTPGTEHASVSMTATCDPFRKGVLDASNTAILGQAVLGSAMLGNMIPESTSAATTESTVVTLSAGSVSQPMIAMQSLSSSSDYQPQRFHDGQVLTAAHMNHIESWLANLEDTAPVNVLESVKVNGKIQTIAADKSVNISIPTKVSELTNDGKYQTEEDVNKKLKQSFENLAITTPEEFGAVGDGVTDDAPALQKALESGRPVKLTKDLYLKSRVLVIDHDVVFDGDGHTLHCDGTALDFKENSDFVAIYSRTIAAEGADCKIYRETSMHYDTYHRGYIEYKGHKPIPVDETYEDYTVTGFMEHRAIVRNLKLSCRNFMGLVALNLRKMCHSLIENVQAVCEDYEGSGSVGILVDTSCFCTIRNCYAYGWDDDLSCKVTNRGYGICANGSGILVDGCEAWDCKHTISVAGNRDYWSTDIRVTNCTFGCNYIHTTRIDGSARFQQVMDSHAGGLGVRFDNCSIIIRNANESASAIAFYLTAPYVHVSNLEVLCDGGGCWATMGGLAELVYLDNVHGDNLVLQPNGMYERAVEFHLNNCLFKRLQNSYNTPLRIYMTGCTITQLVDQVQWLKADGCYFGHDLSWPSHACISILGEGIFTGCTIYGHNEDTIPPTRSIIEAPENSIQMQGCRIYIRRGKYPVFNTNQSEASYWTENIFGFRPGTENDVLDRNELY